MVGGLDPHSSFLNQKEMEELKNITTGEYAGLGLEVGSDNGYLKVISPIDDTPAARAGMKSGDLIVRINDVPVKGMSMGDAVDKMRGEKNTSVVLTIYRKSEDKLFRLKLVRDLIHVQSVKSRLLEDGYGYVRISTFQTQTGKDLETALKTLAKQAGGHLRGLVLDLRNDPGGLLDAAVDVSNSFLNKAEGQKGLIVYTKGRIAGSQFEAHATGSDQLQGAPLVVLINEGSASGSEIVAGALQDHKRGLLVGTNSFGKGSVQTVLPIDQTSALKLTTALYYTPSGRSIQAQGIHPDIYVKELKIPSQKTADDDSIDALKEADLENHLLNGNGQKVPAATKQPPVINKIDNEDETNLLNNDYQLYEGLQILKTLVVSEQKN